jgi:hypothetical protein
MEHRANTHVFAAGSHCKKTYCPHRGNCADVFTVRQTEAADAWFPADVNAMTDEQLAKALDHADILQGLRDELRKAAMGRMLQMDRQIQGTRSSRGVVAGSSQMNGPLSCTSRTFGATDADMHRTSLHPLKRSRISLRLGAAAKTALVAASGSKLGKTT